MRLFAAAFSAGWARGLPRCCGVGALRPAGLPRCCGFAAAMTSARSVDSLLDVAEAAVCEEGDDYPPTDPVEEEAAPYEPDTESEEDDDIDAARYAQELQAEMDSAEWAPLSEEEAAEPAPPRKKLAPNPYWRPSTPPRDLRPGCEACGKKFFSVFTPGLGMTKACFDCIVSGKHEESRAKRFAAAMPATGSSSSNAPPPGVPVMQWNERRGYVDVQGNLRSNEPYRARDDKPTPRCGKRGGWCREWYAAKQHAAKNGTLENFLQMCPKPQKPQEGDS